MKFLRTKGLQFNAVEHCNLKCVECSHFSPWMPTRVMPTEDFFRDLAAVSAVLRTEKFTFVGGEPLLNKDLPALARAVRESGIAETIEVTSNGTLPARVSDALLASIDLLEISVYAGTNVTPESVAAMRRRCEARGVGFRESPRPLFRKMQLDRPNDDPALVQDIYKTCQIAHVWNCHAIHDGMYYKCSRPMFAAKYLEPRGVQGYEARLDGVALHEPALQDRLASYLANPEPLEACRTCLGSVGKKVENRQMSKEEVCRTEPDLTPAATYVDRKLMGWYRWRTRLLLAARTVVRSPGLRRLGGVVVDKFSPRAERVTDRRK